LHINSKSLDCIDLWMDCDMQFLVIQVSALPSTTVHPANGAACCSLI